MKQETLEKYIGKTWGVLTCLGIDHEDYDKEKQIKRTYFKVKCSKCGSISVVRSDRFFGKYIPKSCTNCVNNLQVKTANKKYPRIGEIYRTHVDRCSTTIPKGSTSQANGDGSAELLTAA